MKHIYIKASIVFGSLLFLSSCTIDDVVPQNALVEDTVIRDEASAQSVLNRIYTTYRGPGISGRLPLLSPNIGSRLSTASQELAPVNPDQFGFNTHNVVPSASILNEIYTQEYFTINNANFFIELIERGDADVSTERENEFLAEARFFRGYSHFNLLRFFGQFYDSSSALGVVVSTEPYREAVALPRNNVQEVYNAIINDLEFAANNALENREHFFVSATTARAALAKVQLYMGDFEAAATNALAVINNTDGYALATNYADIFNVKYGPETLFAPFVGDQLNNPESDISAIQYANTATLPSPFFRALADEQDGVPGDGSFDGTTGFDPRFSFGFSDPFGNPKYPFVTLTPGGGNTVNMLRMAEIYLIYAEAEARRSGGNLNDALDALNTIRTRAGVPLKTLVDQSTLLNDIREEKLLELYKETGETWFDLVRYDRMGDINASTLIPTISGVDALIYPIPQVALAGNNLLLPNP